MSAFLAKGILENNGIKAEVLHYSNPYAGISYKMSIDLIVNDDDYEQALKLIELAESEEGLGEVTDQDVEDVQ